MPAPFLCDTVTQSAPLPTPRTLHGGLYSVNPPLQSCASIQVALVCQGWPPIPPSGFVGEMQLLDGARKLRQVRITMHEYTTVLFCAASDAGIDQRQA